MKFQSIPNFDSLAPTTTKGDVIVRTSTTNVRQAIGTDGQVLTADSTQTNGLKWSGVAAGALNVVSKTSAYNAVVNDYILASSSSFTITLPTAIGVSGQQIGIQHNGTSLSQIYTLATTSSQTIGGVASGSYALYTNGETLILVSDGANWQILSHKTDVGPTLYTPTYVGFGTVTTTNITWGRSGSYIFLDGYLLQGSPTGVLASASLPGGMTASTILSAIGSGNLYIVGHAVTSVSTAIINVVLTTGGQSTINFSASNGIPTQAQTGSGLLAGGQVYTISARIPIQGWQP